MSEIKVRTQAKRQVIDITNDVSVALSKRDGAVHVTVLHTGAAITTANLDPGTGEDFLDFLKAITPDMRWRHPHNPSHAPDHLLASLIGPSVSIPVAGGKLVLGTWQYIVLIELDGPRERTVAVTFSGVPR